MNKLIGAALFLPLAVSGQTPLSWQDVKQKFEDSNPTLRAARLNIDESRAQEITAYLRPNPDVGTGVDQIVPFSTQPSPTSGLPVYRPFLNVFPSFSISYLHERDHKRELRRETARKSTDIAASTYDDQARTLLFNLRNAFVQVLQAKAVQQNARENLTYWDKELDVNRKRLAAGDLAQVDMERLELQRVQFESDLETALVNLRTAKIQVLALLDERTPIDRFDLAGAYDFVDRLDPLEQFRNVAMQSRPDLKEAVQNVELAKANHQLAIANGSTDPTFSLDFGRNPPVPFYFGVSVSIPLRIFDRNQGEKARTAVDIRRSEEAQDATKAQVFSDVDSAYYTVVSTLNLLRPYRDKYLKLAEDTRNKVAFSYQNGGASLLDYLDAEKSYRDTRLAYLNLIGSYLTAAAQMNMAVGREVIP
ncbi:MAG TPA: TolC family protein [Bryobacteraceae bacterium]|nr:TolC family protein [Bryobacteraceae bacterium]